MNHLRARKHPDFIVRQEDPFNGGPPLPLLRRSLITPTELFYVRSHGDVPEVDLASYRLEIQGDGGVSHRLTLAELRENFPQVSLAATLQCAGNRRQELMEVKPIRGETPWGAEAIGHAEWTGVRLRDVLEAAGVREAPDETRQVDFSGLDEIEKENRRIHFGGSIPLRKALGAEVLLAYAMNGAALEPLHGFPLRVVAPGYIGARSVKWLSRIRVQNEPSRNYYQRKSYQLFPPNVDEASVDWETGLMLGEMNLSAVICSPGAGDQLPPGRVPVEGYAIAGGELAVARVDLSTDGGENWTQAELLDRPVAWGWRFWQASVELEPGAHQLVARAVDRAANSQPAQARDVWNFKGYMNNAWNRVTITVGERR